MPDFTAAPVKQNIKAATCDDCGAWYAVQDGQVDLTAAMAPVWWAHGRTASELRVDIQLASALVNDQIRVEVWQQAQSIAGGGLLVWSGTLTVANSANGSWFTLGAGGSPQGEAWGMRAQLVAGVGNAVRRIRGRLVGVCDSAALGSIVRGEGVAP